MWTAIIGAVTALIGLAAKFIGGGSSGADKADARKLGQLEQRDADRAADLKVIHDANVADKASQGDAGYDPNDLDAPRR